MMELSEVGTLLGVNNRVLRYLLEQELVPGLTKVNQGRGSRRKLTVAQARLVGVAAAMHVQGFRPPVITTTLKLVKQGLKVGVGVLEVQAGKYVTITINLEKICRMIK